jgi:hypothetical protein
MDNYLVSVLGFVPTLHRGPSVTLTSVFICFSVVNRDSFDAIKEMYNQYWHSDLKKNPCHKILVGLNVDMRTSKIEQKRATLILSNQNELPNYFAMLPKGM